MTGSAGILRFYYVMQRKVSSAHPIIIGDNHKDEAGYTDQFKPAKK